MSDLTPDKIKNLERLEVQLAALKIELDGSAGDGRDKALSPVSFDLLLGLLTEVRDLLEEKRTYVGLPTGVDYKVGDALVLLAQYRALLSTFRAKNAEKRYGTWFWIAVDKGKTRYVPVRGDKDPTSVE